MDNLPLEMLCHISDFLVWGKFNLVDFNSIQSLRLTCKYFSDIPIHGELIHHCLWSLYKGKDRPTTSHAFLQKMDALAQSVYEQRWWYIHYPLNEEENRYFP